MIQCSCDDLDEVDQLEVDWDVCGVLLRAVKAGIGLAVAFSLRFPRWKRDGIGTWTQPTKKYEKYHVALENLCGMAYAKSDSDTAMLQLVQMLRDI